MKNLLLCIIIGIFLLASVSAQLEFFQQDYQYNSSTLIHSLVVYRADTENFITGGSPLEVYAWYDIYVQSWNELNPDYSVSYCNFSVRQYPKTSSNVTFSDSRIFTDDYRNAKYFLRMNDGDTAFFDTECFFNSTNTSILIPANFQIVTPTTECKACQYYEWSVTERDISKAEQVGSQSVDVINIMYQVIYLNFEIWLALFWIVLIVVAIHSTGFIFVGLVWLFAYLKSLIT